MVVPNGHVLNKCSYNESLTKPVITATKQEITPKNMVHQDALTKSFLPVKYNKKSNNTAIESNAIGK